MQLVTFTLNSNLIGVSAISSIQKVIVKTKSDGVFQDGAMVHILARQSNSPVAFWAYGSDGIDL